jgi:DNA mismatch repair ATPase MutS
LFTWLTAWFGLLQLDAPTEAALRGYGLSVFALCGLVTWRFRERTSGIFRDVDEAAHDLALLAGVLGRLEQERFTAPRLAVLRTALDVDGQPPSRRIARLNALMSLVDSRVHLIVRLAGILVLWDVHLAHAIERWRRSSGPAVRRWLAAVGEMEALLSLAGYRHEHPDDVFAEFSDGPPGFDGEALGHPLLADAVMVRNDVRLTGELVVFVVSGSNMSGKSTLLRTVGVNAVLAQAGGPVRARRLRLTPLGIGASIRTEDSLQAGISRFYAEVTRLGAIVRRAHQPPPVLFLIDELLQGTNSHDRRIGADGVVRGLVGLGAIGLVTTHDLALTEMVAHLGAAAANVHFEDRFEDGRLRFDYRLRDGVVRTSNALALMRSVGLEVGDE